MTSRELREKYLQFFKTKGHSIVSSASLLPENDPTTLFTGSGMQPMVPYLLGEKHPNGQRICDSQKCFRAGDIDDVGDNRHTTFFEMLGNWSLGDYFKREQIPWMFEFLTKELGLDPNRLYFTVYQGNEQFGITRDDEAVELWQAEFKKVGVEARAVMNAHQDGMQGGRIFYYNEKENWWSRAGVPEKMPMGEPGGPDSEMFWDFGAELGLHEKSEWRDQPCHPACDCGRFVEIGNNVFMQFVKTENGFEELQNKNIDFGGGLERLAVAVADNPDIFMGDVFTNLRNGIEQLCGKKYGENQNETKAFRVVMDHLRAATFLIGDGAFPSNKDQGYFTRRLIRRAIRFASVLGADNNFTRNIAQIVIGEYSSHYENLKKEEDIILSEIEKEELKFRRTLKQGEKMFLQSVDRIKSDGGQIFSGQIAFDLFQSYGYPVEMTIEMAQENNLQVDMVSFDEAMEKHKDLSRTASAGKFKGGLADSSEETTKLHTAAHLLLESLRRVLGDHVTQRGSNITAERLRFDFTHSEKMTDKQKEEVESMVNQIIHDNLLVACEEMSLERARELGAMGVFDAKYGELVKVYQVGDGGNVFSREICGGPHISNTGVLKSFKIEKEESSSAGVRRIKATLGE